MFEVKWIWFDDSVWSQMDFWIIFISCWDQTNDNCVVGEVSFCPNQCWLFGWFFLCVKNNHFSNVIFSCQPNPWWLIGRNYLQFPLYSWLYSSPTVHCWGFLLFVHLPNSIGFEYTSITIWGSSSDSGLFAYWWIGMFVDVDGIQFRSIVEERSLSSNTMLIWSIFLLL